MNTHVGGYLFLRFGAGYADPPAVFRLLTRLSLAVKRMPEYARMAKQSLAVLAWAS